MEKLTALLFVIHESDDGPQWKALPAAAAGQQIWVLVGPGLAVCREEAGGERWGGALLRVRAPRWKPGGQRGGLWRPGRSRGHPQGRGTHPEVPMQAGARARDSPEDVELRGIRGAHVLGAPSGRETAWRRLSTPKSPDLTLADQVPCAKDSRLLSCFTSMTRSAVSMSASGSGSKRRGTRPAFRRDMGRGRGSR